MNLSLNWLKRVNHKFLKKYGSNILPYKLSNDINSDYFIKKGLSPSQIGVLLRDQHGIAQVKVLTGKKILRILKKNGKI